MDHCKREREIDLLLQLCRLDVEASFPGRGQGKDRGRLVIAAEALAVLDVAGGALFEAAYTLDGAFLRDETYENLGASIQAPPWVADKRDEIIARLEPIAY